MCSVMAHLPNIGGRHCIPGIVSGRGGGSPPPTARHQGNRRPFGGTCQDPVRSSNLLALGLSRCIRLRTMRYSRNKMRLWLHGACMAALLSFWEGHVRTWWRAILVSGARAIASKLGVSTGWVATWFRIQPAGTPPRGRPASLIGAMVCGVVSGWPRSVANGRAAGSCSYRSVKHP